MKKVLLTKSQQICVTTPEIKLKPQNGVTPLPSICSSGVRVMSMQTNVITNTYIQRKSHQSIYEDIFKLLMRLPDKALQERVIDAINGRSDKSPISNVNQCKQCSKGNEQKPKKVNASTQTETNETSETKEKTTNKSEPTTKDELNVNLKEEGSSIKNESATQSTSVAAESQLSNTSVKVPRKRGRKRNTCVPQVVKRSAAQMALQEREDKQLTPLPPVKKKRIERPVSKVKVLTKIGYNFVFFLCSCRNLIAVLIILLKKVPYIEETQCSPTAPWA